MGALPKRRSSTSKQGKRRQRIKLVGQSLSKCTNCGAAKMHHQACPSCGFFR